MSPNSKSIVADTAKVRMQISGAQIYRNIYVGGIPSTQPQGFIPVLTHMAKTEGVPSWWKGLPAALHRQFIYATLR